MTNQLKYYETLGGGRIQKDELSAEELQLFQKVLNYYKKDPSWQEFSDFVFKNILNELETKLSRQKIIKTSIYRICKDLESRLKIKQRVARLGNYQDILEILILDKYPSKYQFCKKFKIDEGFLSNVLHGKKSFSIDALDNILNNLGYVIEIRRKNLTSSQLETSLK